MVEAAGVEPASKQTAWCLLPLRAATTMKLFTYYTAKSGLLSRGGLRLPVVRPWAAHRPAVAGLHLALLADHLAGLLVELLLLPEVPGVVLRQHLAVAIGVQEAALVKPGDQLLAAVLLHLRDFLVRHPLRLGTPRLRRWQVQVLQVVGQVQRRLVVRRLAAPQDVELLLELGLAGLGVRPRGQVLLVAHQLGQDLRRALAVRPG